MNLDSDQSPHDRGGSSGQYLFDVVHDVISDFAPAELELVAAERERTRAGHRPTSKSRKRDDPLGFGLDEAVVLASPVVWAAIQHVADQTAEKAADGLYMRARILVRRALHRRSPPAPLPHFGQPQLAKIHRTVIELARDSGMERKRAEQLADRVVARLVLSDHDEGTG